MNKIYKVIWSKTRNCYVAVAEFVKRNGKGGSVLNRRHIAAALAAVAICAAPAGALANTGGHWEGNDYFGDAPDYKVVIDSDVSGNVYGRRESDKTATGASVMVESGTVGNELSWSNVYGGYSSSFSGTATASDNEVTISGGTANYVCGGKSSSLSGTATASGNEVTISGGTVNWSVYGGYSSSFSGTATASGNEVTISGGTVNYVYGGLSDSVYGGLSDSGNAEKNTVTISGGKVEGTVYGGYSWNGDAVNNTVILSRQGSEAPPDINGTLFGGLSDGGGAVSGNTLQVEAVGLSAPEIQNFENYRFVLPKDIKAGDTMLTLKSQINNLEIDAAKVSVSSNVGKTGLNLDESVTLLHKTGGEGAFSVTNLTGAVQTSKLDGVSNGFDVMKYKLDKPANEDKLDVTVSELYLYGDGGTNTPGQRQTGNTLTITGGKANAAFGGRASSGDVTGNIVTMEGGELIELTNGSNPNYGIAGSLCGGASEGEISPTGSASGSAIENTVTVTGGTVQRNVFGGRSSASATANRVILSKVDGKEAPVVEWNLYGGTSAVGIAENNEVTIRGGKVQGNVYGGYSNSGKAENNTVTVSGGTVNGWVYGGRSEKGIAENNTLIISGGTVKNDVYGGYSVRGAATDNTVILSRQGNEAAPDINGTLFGGFSYAGSTVSNNTLQVEAVGLSAPEIRNFENYKFVLPSDVKKGDTMLTLKGQGADLTIDGTKVDMAVAKGSGLNIDFGESITLLHKTGGSGAFSVTNLTGAVQTSKLDGEAGGLDVMKYKLENPADKLNVTVSELFLYGDGGTNTPGQRERGNTLEIKGGKATAAFGGRATTGDVTGNKVEMSGGELVYDTLYADIQGSLYGGLADSLTDKGNANHNTITVSGGKLKERVYGGASYDGNTENNTVTIKGGTVGTHVYGGRTYGGGNAVNNTVTIEGGTVGKRVYGGRSDGGNAVNNAVTIKGGTVGERVYGGFSNGDDAERNTVNLTGTTHGLDGTQLYGYNDGAASHSGNELHIGGAKTYDKNGEAVITKGSWQGMDGSGKHTNRVDMVSNFDSIALHNVVWGDVPALAAKEIKNIGGLDVTGLEFFTHPDNSTVHKHALKDYMVLVHGDNNDLTGLKISYLDEGNVKTETLTNQGIHYHNTTHHSTENGVTVDGKEVKRIFLADHNKSVDFCFHVTGDKLTVGEVDFVKNGTARILDGRFDVRNAAIDTDGLLFTEASWNKMHTGDTMTIVDAEDAVANKNGATLQPFTAVQLTKTFAESDAAKSITIEGLRTGTLAQDAARTKLTYTVGTVDIDTIRLGAVSWNPNGTLLNAGGDVFRYGTVQGVDAAGFAVDYKNPQTVEATKIMTLLQANNTLQANALLANMAAEVKTKTYSYQFVPADGVTVAAKITGSLGTTPKGDGFTYTVNSNQADRLTFGSVDWKDSGALFKRPAAVTFAGAAVDTSEIHFKNLKELKGNAQMTLVSDFGGNPGRIMGTTYKIGTTLEGEGAASLANGDLIFTTKTGTKNHAQDQTHNTVMGMTAGLAALAGGTEQLSQGMESLNDGDGSGGQEETESGGMIIASIGGNKMRQETGSHVTSNTWNGVLGIGGKRAVKSGTWQYAAFAEHGRANLTLHSDTGRGEGTSKYTGGGLLAKWQSRHDVYVEGSIRAGRMHDTASDMLYDAATGQSYGYDVHANYIGGHVGFGKVFNYRNGRSLDVYGKYFHMKRDGVSFEAEGHYDLDSVTSSVLRVGARYGATDKKWNWYGGLAYEYEFDGKATGRADGAEIRAASIKGGSVRGELGLRMEATKTSPWKADIRLTGYAGKRWGIGGNVSVAYTF